MFFHAIISRMTKQQAAVYVMANQTRRVMYIGATRNLAERVEAHKNGAVSGFSKKYRCHFLVHVEFYDDWNAATQRERQLKDWKRAWKQELIRKANPHWRDLSEDIF